MLRSIKELTGYPIEAKDGSIGKVKDCLFDDRHWRLRYVVADTNRWLPGKKVLISPYQIEKPAASWQGKHLPVSLSKEQIESAPELSEHAPVSRQYEKEYARHFQQTRPYWEGPYAWGMVHEPLYMPIAEERAGSLVNEQQKRIHEYELSRIEESHLRSADELIGYTINATDESFGHVEDFIVDTSKWKLVYLVIDTRNWLPGRKSLVDIRWIEGFNWQNHTATVGLSRSQIEAAPEYNPEQAVNRDYEAKLYDYYGRPYHWEEDHRTSVR